MQFSPIMLLHICSGGVGLLSGAVAISVRKGSRIHAKTGIVFSVAMLLLGATGAYIAFTLSQTGNILGGILTVYMIATAWIAGKRRAAEISWFDWVALLVALAIGAACWSYGFQVLRGTTSSHDGVPAGMDFFLGAVILIAAGGDLRMILRGGIFGTQRIARHLWRMCFGLFIASGSFFMGRQRIFPEFIQRSNVLIFLTVLPLILLIFWLVRVRFAKAYKQIALQHRTGADSLST